METFFSVFLILLGILQPFAWGIVLFKVFSRGSRALQTMTNPKPTVNIDTFNMQINYGKDRKFTTNGY